MNETRGARRKARLADAALQRLAEKFEPEHKTSRRVQCPDGTAAPHGGLAVGAATTPAGVTGKRHVTPAADETGEAA